jgi:NAD-dependent deacetylase
MKPFQHRITQAVRIVEGSQWIAAFTGAGISTESGISDFRSKGGVWERYRIVTYQEFITSHEARVEYWKMKHELFQELKQAQPNAAHTALAELGKRGRLKCLVTQNIDGLHQDAGSREVIELHGTGRRAVCIDCGKDWTIEEVQERVKAEGYEPRCDRCRGYVKPATISFGQPMPEVEMSRAFACAQRCDLMLMVGSSLQVEPAASIPREAHRNGARLIYINRTETPTDDLASLIFRENAGDVLSALVDALA